VPPHHVAIHVHLRIGARPVAGGPFPERTSCCLAGLATSLEDAKQLQAMAQQANHLRTHQQQQAQQLQQQSNALCASAHAYKQHQLAHMLPQAEAASTKAALVLQQAQEDLLGAVDDWWHLPAVNAAADNRYGDENMAGWRDRIREVHARLAQLGARS
jgi:hypothetical protein